MKNLMIKAIKKYQVTLSPKLHERGVRCLFDPSCSQYAINVLETHNVIIGLALIVYRLLSCNPINASMKRNKLKNNNQLYGKRI